MDSCTAGLMPRSARPQPSPEVCTDGCAVSFRVPLTGRRHAIAESEGQLWPVLFATCTSIHCNSFRLPHAATSSFFIYFARNSVRKLVGSRSHNFLPPPNEPISVLVSTRGGRPSFSSLYQRYPNHVRTVVFQYFLTFRRKWLSCR